MRLGSETLACRAVVCKQRRRNRPDRRSFGSTSLSTRCRYPRKSRRSERGAFRSRRSPEASIIGARDQMGEPICRSRPRMFRRVVQAMLPRRLIQPVPPAVLARFCPACLLLAAHCGGRPRRARWSCRRRCRSIFPSLATEATGAVPLQIAPAIAGSAEPSSSRRAFVVERIALGHARFYHRPAEQRRS